MKVIPIRRICHFLGNHQRVLSVFRVLSGTHCIGVNVSETGGTSPHEDLEHELCSTSNARAAKDMPGIEIYLYRLQRSSNPCLPCDSLEIFDGSPRSPFLHFLHLGDGRFRVTRLLVPFGPTTPPLANVTNACLNTLLVRIPSPKRRCGSRHCWDCDARECSQTNSPELRQRVLEQRGLCPVAYPSV